MNDLTAIGAELLQSQMVFDLLALDDFLDRAADLLAARSSGDALHVPPLAEAWTREVAAARSHDARRYHPALLTARPAVRFLGPDRAHPMSARAEPRRPRCHGPAGAQTQLPREASDRRAAP